MGKEGGGRACLLGKALAHGPRPSTPAQPVCTLGPSRSFQRGSHSGSWGQPGHVGHHNGPVPVCPVDGDSELILVLQTELSWGGFCGHFLPFIFFCSLSLVYRLDSSDVFVSFCFTLWEISSILSSIFSISSLISLFLKSENSEGFFFYSSLLCFAIATSSLTTRKLFALVGFCFVFSSSFVDGSSKFLSLCACLSPF